MTVKKRRRRAADPKELKNHETFLLLLAMDPCPRGDKIRLLKKRMMVMMMLYCHRDQPRPYRSTSMLPTEENAKSPKCNLIVDYSSLSSMTLRFSNSLLHSQ
jgi:hypothetical protein